MELSIWKNPRTMTTVFKLEIPDRDYLSIEINKWDRLLLGECDRSNKISDKLLALEKLASLIECNEHIHNTFRITQ